MRYSVPIMVLAVAGLVACSSGSATPSDARAEPSGQQGERRFALDGFDKVSLAGPDSVEVRVGPAFSVVARGDTGVMEALEIKRDGSTLEVGRKRRDGFSWGSREEGAPVRITVTLPALRGVSLAGSGDMTVDRATAEAFEVSLAGSGDIAIGTLQTGAGEVTIAGSGDVRLSGAAEAMDVSIAGSGDLDAAGLSARRGSVSIAGSGNARFNVDGEASVSLLGSGDADLGAKARCRTTKMGSGEARCGG